MPAFAYTALDTSGKQVTGSLAVSTRAEVYRQLESQRLTPIKVAEETTAAAKAAKEEAKDNSPAPVLKRAQLILFTEELADLMDGGLQLEQALRVMHERQESPVLRKVSGRIREQLREGATFSKALLQASPSFDEMYCNLATAGEVSGSLPQILRRLSASITQMHDLQSRVVAALVYPAFMFGALIMLLIVFSTVLLPGFVDMLSKSRTKLPFVMEMLGTFSDLVKHWWWLALAVIVSSVLLFRSYIAKESGKMWWDRAKLKIPLFGPVLTARFNAQFAASLGNLVNNGIPLLNALKLTAKSTSNVFLRGLLNQAAGIIGEGVSLSSALRKVGHLPVLLVDMVAMGEQTGRLGKSLEKIAARYDKELDGRVKRVTALITPIVLVILFVVVGVVAISIVTAIFETMTSVRAHS
ncbi:type II secretion system F family protein [Verrucomicrobium spinosum]|uniref:type II secretion system F family protein n=1 Tax=Verrucomicrobium spinosum TaxID=2736 RepID=UPI000174561A|nr:type II secretion system F family protein [Verrucomicrobium spinosum]